MYISHSVMEGQRPNNPLTRVAFGGPGLAGIYQIVSILDFIGGAKGQEGDGDNWSYNTCKAPVKMSPPTNQHPVYFTGRMPFLSPNQQCQSAEGETFVPVVMGRFFCAGTGVDGDELVSPCSFLKPSHCRL